MLIFLIGLTVLGPFLIIIFIDYFSDLTRSSYDVIEGIKKHVILKNFYCTTAIAYFMIWGVLVTLSQLLEISNVQLVFIWFLIVLAFIDYRVKFLPDVLTLGLLWLGLIASAAGWIPISPESAIWGATLIYLGSRFMNYLFYLWRGQDGLGRGDMKLLAAIAAWNGLTALLPIIFLASITAAMFGLAITAIKKNSSLSLPFGPFLSLAALVYLLLLRV